MNAEDLLILAAAGFGVWYVMHQSSAAAAASPSAPAPSPVAPLNNPIASLAPFATPMLAPSPGPAPAPPVPVMAPAPQLPPVMQTAPSSPGGPMLLVNADPLVPTYTPGPIPPSPTIQPGVIPTLAAPVSSIQVAPSYTPHFSYELSRSGTLYPGDNWGVNIWNAKPGSPVSMTLTQQGGNSVTNNIGTVNSSGNFWYTGNVSTGQDGQWSQVWYVGGQQVGAFSFTVFDPVVNAAPPVTTYNSNIPNSPIGTPTAPRTGNLIVGGVVYGGAPLNI